MLLHSFRQRAERGADHGGGFAREQPGLGIFASGMFRLGGGPYHFASLRSDWHGDMSQSSQYTLGDFLFVAAGGALICLFAAIVVFAK